ncbi:MAG: hypothetical protein HY795_15210 [Desulfovibrio sp.]|nr:hypothetical protein [Desulfovibrio sp.]MBI4960641.1 hypothetical protein [Desulfovibrio sp.]
MLFILNSLDHSKLEEIGVLGGSEDKSILLYGDAVYYAAPSMVGKLAHLEPEEMFACQDALSARNISPDSSVEAIDYERIAEMIVEDHDRVVSL